MRNVLLILMVVAAVGCGEQQTETPQPAPVDQTPTVAPAGQKDIMAYVGETPIYMDELNDMLVQSYGLSYARILVANELVRQAAEAEGVKITDADVEAETDLMLQNMLGSAPEPDQREKLLNYMKNQNRITDEQWDMFMHRGAMLRKLAELRVKVTDEMVKDAYAQRYGRKYMVSHIEVATLDKAHEVLKMIEEGADFTKLAAEHSIAPTGRSGGMLPPIGGKAPESPTGAAIHKVAVAMKEVGQISNPVQAGTTFHILKLEEIIEPKDVKFDDVKAELTKLVSNMEVTKVQQQIMIDLVRTAQSNGTIRYVNPILKSLNDKQDNARGTQP